MKTPRKERDSSKRLSKEQIEKKLETIRKGDDEDEGGLEFDEITGVMDFAIAKTKKAGDKCVAEVQKSIDKLDEIASKLEKKPA